jgi:hypothetical protein
MPDKWIAIVEHFNLPARIRVKHEGTYQEPELTGEYMNRIIMGLREQGLHFDMPTCGAILRDVLAGEKAENSLSIRLWKDEPIAAAD